MRGKDWEAAEHFPPERITPAYAGKSSPVKINAFRNSDHPRLCGEKGKYENLYSQLKGSPPPMRGKVILNHLEPLSRRITPAYAGKSKISAFRRCRFSDHPRLCGEKPETYCVKICRTGSPPPMRGKASTTASSASWGGDHPRLCGEKQFIRNPLEHELGSPPPMRGKVLFRQDFRRCYRITPAYAGKRNAVMM